MSTFGRTKQCKACPWKKSTRPDKDIPGGYDPEKHQKLVACQSDNLNQCAMMACHESDPGKEYACVGWVVNQLGPGNNIGLRLRVLLARPGQFITEGEQYDSVDAMCASAPVKKSPALKRAGQQTRRPL